MNDNRTNENPATVANGMRIKFNVLNYAFTIYHPAYRAWVDWWNSASNEACETVGDIRQRRGIAQGFEAK